jgi:hypothetical protein
MQLCNCACPAEWFVILFRIGAAREATQALMGVAVFLLPLEVQVCSSINAVTCNKIQPTKLDPPTTLHTLHT